MLNTEATIDRLESQDKLKPSTVCQQCLHNECRAVCGEVCAMCFEGYNCIVAQRASREMSHGS